MMGSLVRVRHAAPALLTPQHCNNPWLRIAGEASAMNPRDAARATQKGQMRATGLTGFFDLVPLLRITKGEAEMSRESAAFWMGICILLILALLFRQYAAVAVAAMIGVILVYKHTPRREYTEWGRPLED